MFKILKDQKAILKTVCLIFQSNQIMHLVNNLEILNNPEILNNLAFLKYSIDIMIKRNFQKYLNCQEKALREWLKPIILIMMKNKILKPKICIFKVNFN